MRVYVLNFWRRVFWHGLVSPSVMEDLGRPFGLTDYCRGR